MDYAPNDTSAVEKFSATAQFNRPRIPQWLKDMRLSAFERKIPTCDDETLNFLMNHIRSAKPRKILEIGTATGVSGCAALVAHGGARLITIEKNAEFYEEAKQNFASAGLCERAELILGDAAEELSKLKGGFDLIFLDAAKAQYVKWLPQLKKLLKKGGVLLADDVLLYGYVAGETEVPPKRRALVGHIREYIAAAVSDPELSTTVINIGDGLCFSVRL